MKLAFLGTVAIAALSISSAHAQNAGAGADGATGAGAEAATSGDSGIEDIVVTAQRRAENLQKSSLAISVISADTMSKAGVSSTTDLTKVLPGVQIGINGPVPQIFIRGVGDFGSVAITNPAVALNVGGVYYARPGAAGGAFYDLERIEVLKGPQGTLYGRNASGGAINILPARPVLGRTGMALNLEVGNYESILSDGSVNLPVGDAVALRASYQIAHRDGYLSNGSNDDIHQAVRLQALWEPSSDLSVLLFGSYYHMGGIGSGFALYDPKGNPATGRAPLPSFDPWTAYTDPRVTALATIAGLPPPLIFPAESFNSSLYQNNTYWNFHATVEANLGFATLTVIPSYQHTRHDYFEYPTLAYQSRSDAGNGPPETSEAYSLETRLSNESDFLKWVVGAFYYREKQAVRYTTHTGLVQFSSAESFLDTESYAFFAQATASLTDRFRLTGGLRYTSDKRDLDGAVYNDAFPAFGIPRTLAAIFVGASNASKVNYKIGVEYDLAPDNMLYASVATGFKGGGPQLGDEEPYKPENLRAFEVGSRNRFLDNRLQINLEAFYWQYNDHQEFVVGPDRSGYVAPLLRNAGKAKSYGADLDVIFRFTDNDTLSGNVEYNKTRYTVFNFVQPLAFLPTGQTDCSVTPTGEFGPVGPTATVDCSGRRLTHAPLWSGAVNYNHRFDLTNGGEVNFSADMKFASSRELSVNFIPNTFAKSYQTFNASLSYDTPDRKLSLTAFVRNITNEAVYTSGQEAPYVVSAVSANISPPRTYGAKISYRY